MSSESSIGGVADTFSNVASLSSTPPTTVADSISLASESSKHEHAIASDPIEDPVHDVYEAVTPPEPMVTEAVAEAAMDAPDATVASSSTEIPSPRARRNRASLPVYNIAKLSGTAIHGKRRSKGDVIVNRRRTISGDTLVGNDSAQSVNEPADKVVRDGIDALDIQWSMRGLDSPKSRVPKKRALSPEPKRPTRSTGSHAENIAYKLSALGKRGRKTIERGMSNMSREMRRLQDTNEFAGVDTKPVLYTTWAKGKLVTHSPEPARKKAKVSESPKKAAVRAPSPVPEVSAPKPRRSKKWLDHGLYSGQDAPLDITKHLTPNEKKALAELPELIPSGKVNKTLPQPLFNGLRLLIKGRDYKLPFDICNPLPPGQPKPDAWRMMTRNRFVGNAAAYWKRKPHFKDYQSKCVCTPEDGCGESCQNRIMLYECDNTNCNAGVANCQNRAFAKLQERVKAGGKYRVGVEVIKTDDRGHGIRSNRCFQPHQIIMEYTGEIITEEECDRRMNEKYKDNECYYLMSFDQNMIIDATTGSITRFVNHSCQPNCRMIKWIVSGQPRMALFAGDRPIMTGDELTYDYNFDPFSAKNVQKCLCGSDNCRGVLGPKPKEVKPPKLPKADLKKVVKKGVNAGKRKLKEILGDMEDTEGSALKKRKIKTPTGVKAKGIKRSLSDASHKAARGAAKVVKKSVSTISVARAAIGSKNAASARQVATIRRKSSVVKTYSKTKSGGGVSPTPKKSASRHSSLTIVAAGGRTPSSTKSTASTIASTTPAKRGRPRKHPLPSASPRKAVELPRSSNQIRLVQSPSQSI
ncbi:hypothetical protein BJ170DRAFT_578572 [Xylariales sp. AK1849]|nr:hypothetical protein BJ170DRAFT_578572 [Xylariales sp. AK1849]